VVISVKIRSMYLLNTSVELYQRKKEESKEFKERDKNVTQKTSLAM